jgi:hypothetical protein
LRAFTDTAVLAHALAKTVLRLSCCRHIFLIQRGEPFITPAGLSGKCSVLSDGQICLALSGVGPWSLDAWLFGSQHNYRFASEAGAR